MLWQQFIWESSQWLGKNIVQSTGIKSSRKTWTVDLAALMNEMTLNIGIKLINQTNSKRLQMTNYSKHLICLTSLPNDKIFDLSKLKAFADNKIIVTQKLKFALWWGRKHCGKRRKCWLPAFSPFSTIFSNGYFFRVVKSRDCVVKSQIGFCVKKKKMLVGNQKFLSFPQCLQKVNIGW